VRIAALVQMSVGSAVDPSAPGHVDHRLERECSVHSAVRFHLHLLFGGPEFKSLDRFQVDFSGRSLNREFAFRIEKMIAGAVEHTRKTNASVCIGGRVELPVRKNSINSGRSGRAGPLVYHAYLKGSHGTFPALLLNAHNFSFAAECLEQT